MTLHPGTIATQTPDRIAAIFGDTAMTYATLDTQSRAIAAQLATLGLGQGDVVALVVGNRPDFLSICWAAQRSGLYYLPIPTKLTAPEIAYIVRDSGAKAIIIDPQFVSVTNTALIGASITMLSLGDCDGMMPLTLMPGTMPEQPAIEGCDMLYTSGSTGQPKGVRRTITGEPLGSDSRRVDRARDLFGMGGDTVFYSPAPLYHAAPLRFMMNLLRTGATVIGAEKFDAAAALATIAQHRVTHSQWVPTMFARMLALPRAECDAHDLSSHKVAIHGAAPCPTDTKRAMIGWWGPILHEYYSGTESVGFTHATSAQWLARPGTVGLAYGSIVHVLRDDGGECAAGETGTIYFEGRSGMAYHNDAAKTAAAHDANGWVTMGDIGHVDADGFLFLTDRRAFTIISGGVNIYPAEIEAAFAGHEAMVDIAVFGVPDRDFGEAVFALIELAGAAEPSEQLAHELMAHAAARLASFKLPAWLAFGAVGRSETGKLAKADLRRRYADCGAAFYVKSMGKHEAAA